MNRAFPKPDGPALRSRALLTTVLALMAGVFWLAPVSARDEARAGGTGLRALEVWKGQAFGSGGRADFSEGFEKGLESLGKALVRAIAPQLKDRLELVPVFRSGIGSYSVTIGYRETGLTILASAMQAGARIEVRRLETEDVEKWVARTGPLPAEGAERQGTVEVFARGLRETGNYLRDWGLIA